MVESDRLYGTLNLLILRTLLAEPLHGLAILRSIENRAEGGLRIEEGALYPALHRLERDGLIGGYWGLSANRRRAKFYELTQAGQKRCDQEVQRWLRHTSAVARALGLDLATAVAAMP